MRKAASAIETAGQPQLGWRAGLIVALKGFCMGTADVIPGVSGGTMAFILGIYQRLLEAVRAFDTWLLRLLWRREFRAAARHTDALFLLCLGAGIFAALMFFTRIVALPELIRNYPELIYALFFGLIAASVWLLLRAIPGLGGREILLVAGGSGLGWIIVNLVPFSTPETPGFVFLSGALAICAMILPGVSGSFVLLVLRKYEYVFEGIGNLDWTIILPFGLGAVTGLMLFSRVLVWLLRNYYRKTLALIIGVLVGSLWMMWPFQERTYALVKGESRLIGSDPVWPQAFDQTALAAFALMAAGAAAVWALHMLASQRLRSA